MSTDGHAFTDSTVACLIGASLPTPAACQEAVAILREALVAGVSQKTLWHVSGTAVWDGLDAARAVLAAALGSAQNPFTPASDRIVFGDLDAEDAISIPEPLPDAPHQPSNIDQMPMFDS